MKDVLRIIKELQATSGRIEKENILKLNKDNELLKGILNFAFNTYIVTGLSSKKIVKKLPKLVQKPLNLVEIMRYLESNCTGRDIDIQVVQNFLDSIEDEEEKNLCVEIVTKTLKIGCTAKTLNKIYGNDFIPTFGVMLAEKYFDNVDKVKDKEFTITMKRDGCFIGKSLIRTKEGLKPIREVKVDDYVQSFNEHTKEVSYKRVVNTFKNGEKKEWIKIKTYETNLDKKKSNQVIATPNHNFFTCNGWKRADELSVGDKVYTYDYKIPKEVYDFLIGAGLGDGSVIKDNKDINSVRFEYPKVSKEPYLEYMKNIKEMFGDKSNCLSSRASGYGSKIDYFRVKTLKNCPDCLYNNNNIVRTSYRFTKEILENFTPLSLAVLYIDDGSKARGQDDEYYNTKNKISRAEFSFYRHKKEEIELFKQWLESEYGIESNINFGRKEIKTEGDGYILTISAKSSYKFFELISKYIPRQIRPIKLPKQFHDVEEIKWWENKIEYGLVESTIHSLEKENKVHNSYDIEVEENHTYIIENFAVHNCRAIFIKENGMVKSFTRQGQQYEGLVELEEELKNIEYDNFVVDGELMVLNDTEINSSEQFKETMKIVRKDGEKHGVKLVVFDYMPLDDFKRGRCDYPYSLRRETLEEVLSENNCKYFEPVKKLYVGSDINMIIKLLDEVTSNGEEGIMVNVNDAPYECKRVKTLLKVKKFQTVDLRIIDVVEGTGKYVGTTGAIVVEYKSNSVSVGTGLTDTDREYFWNNKESVVGRVAEIKYFEESTNQKNDELSLRFPVFVRVREDGKEVSLF